MKIAVIGCSHGELDRIYDDINRIETNDGIVVDLVIICGDFQSIRNENDLQCIAVPNKYRHLGLFYKYYCGESIAPKLTLFVGGNHEASNYLQTLSFGGWVANNIYYLGYASVVRFKGLRIGGVSGIHQRSDTNLGHFERLPYDESTKRSAYHMRQSDVYKLMQLNNGNELNSQETQQPIDIFISHDWPLNIHSCGDVQYLLRRKQHFRNDIQHNCLGNPLLEPLVNHLKPKHWFSAHLHVRFEAVVNHTNDCQIQTKFLALDKVLPNRKYLEIIDIEPTVPSTDDSLQYDPEWLAILKATDQLLSIDRKCSTPPLWSQLHSSTQSIIDEVNDKFKNDFKIPENFVMSEPASNGRLNDTDPQRLRNFTNPQTTQFCDKLGITDPIAAIIESMKAVPNPDQISISDDDEEYDENPQKRHKLDDNIDGGDIFFIDRKGDDIEKGDHSIEMTNKNESNIAYIQETVAQNQVIDLTIDDQIVNNNKSESKSTSATEPNASTGETLTKRQLKRRAEKLKRQTELKQLERLDAKKMPNNNNNNNNNNNQKIFKKLENKKASEARRRLIIERLEWVKVNLPMKSENAEIVVLPFNELSLQTIEDKP